MADLDKKWKVEIIDAGDNSGDFIIILPDEILAQLGWKLDDVLTVEVVDNKIILKKC